MKITVEQRAQYGAISFHPVCTTAQHFAAIAKTKTLTAQALKTIQAMGYAIEVKHPAAAF